LPLASTLIEPGRKSDVIRIPVKEALLGTWIRGNVQMAVKCPIKGPQNERFYCRGKDRTVAQSDAILREDGAWYGLRDADSSLPLNRCDPIR